MLDVSMAKKLIERVTEYTSYNVNIMNEDGVIIASRDPERVGTFHEAAYQIVHGGKDIITVEGDHDYPGVLRGMNMVIDIDGRREGVVGVTGNPDEIRPVALITKMAIETMIKYENQKLQSIRRQTRKERFAEMLTHEPNPDPNYIRGLARELNYHEDIVRIPVLCRPEQPKYVDALLETIKSSSSHGGEDISFTLDDKYVLVYKTLDTSKENVFSDYKYILADYLGGALKWMREENIGCRFFVGTFQSNFTQYYYSYRHCRWLADNIHSEHTAVYFYDNAGKYIQQLLPQKELQQIFNVFGSSLSSEFKKDYCELVGSLIDNDFNIAAAARQIFMHKNTFVYRYNKVRDMLNVNPQASPRDKWLLIYLYLYMTP